MGGCWLPDGLLLTFAEPQPASAPARTRRPSREERPDARRRSTVRLRYTRARAARAVGEDRGTAVANYYVGNDPARWRTGAPMFGRVRQADLYPGVSIDYYGRQGALEYDLVLAPGADAAQIRLGVEGASHVGVGPDGSVRIETPVGVLEQPPPTTYQEGPTGRIPARARFVKTGPSELGPVVEQADARLPLVIDPVLDLARLDGGSADESGEVVDLDPGGAIYVAGHTTSVDLPGTIKPPKDDDEVFLSGFEPDGTLRFATYLGGREEDEVAGLRVDGRGHLHLAGTTSSPDFPMRQPFINRLQGPADGWVAMFSSAGRLQFSSYFGGSDRNSIRGLDIDAAGAVTVVGTMSSFDLPVTQAIQPLLNGGFHASDDRGAHWEPRNRGLSHGFDVIEVDPLEPARIYAARSDPGVFWVTNDRGVTWRKSLTPPDHNSQAPPIVASPHRAGTVFFGTLRSDDGGETWQAVRNAPDNILAVDPRGPTRSTQAGTRGGPAASPPPSCTSARTMAPRGRATSCRTRAQQSAGSPSRRPASSGRVIPRRTRTALAVRSTSAGIAGRRGPGSASGTKNTSPPSQWIPRMSNTCASTGGGTAASSPGTAASAGSGRQSRGS